MKNIKQISAFVFFLFVSKFFKAQLHWDVFSNSIGANSKLFLEKSYNFSDVTDMTDPSGKMFFVVKFDAQDENDKMSFIEYSVIYNRDGDVDEVDIVTSEKSVFDSYITYCNSGYKLEDSDSKSEKYIVGEFHVEIERIKEQGFLFYWIKIRKE